MRPFLFYRQDGSILPTFWGKMKIFRGGSKSVEKSNVGHRTSIRIFIFSSKQNWWLGNFWVTVILWKRFLGQNIIKISLWKYSLAVITILQSGLYLCSLLLQNALLDALFSSVNSELVKSWHWEDTILIVTLAFIWCKISRRSFNLMCRITEAESEEQGSSITHWMQGGCKDTGRNPCFGVLGWKNGWGGGWVRESLCTERNWLFKRENAFWWPELKIGWAQPAAF